MLIHPRVGINTRIHTRRRMPANRIHKPLALPSLLRKPDRMVRNTSSSEPVSHAQSKIETRKRPGVIINHHQCTRQPAPIKDRLVAAKCPPAVFESSLSDVALQARPQAARQHRFQRPRPQCPPPARSGSRPQKQQPTAPQPRPTPTSGAPSSTAACPHAVTSTCLDQHPHPDPRLPSTHRSDPPPNNKPLMPPRISPRILRDSYVRMRTGIDR